MNLFQLWILNVFNVILFRKMFLNTVIADTKVIFYLCLRNIATLEVIELLFIKYSVKRIISKDRTINK